MCGATSCVSASGTKKFNSNRLRASAKRRAPGRIVEAHAGVVDQDIDRAEPIERGSHGGFADLGHG